MSQSKKYTKDKKDIYIAILSLKEAGYTIPKIKEIVGATHSFVAIVSSSLGCARISLQDLKYRYDQVWPDLEYELRRRTRHRHTVYHHYNKSIEQEEVITKKDIGRKEAYNRAIEHTFHPGDQINGYKYISEYPHFNLWLNIEKGYTECFFKNERPHITRKERMQ